MTADQDKTNLKTNKEWYWSNISTNETDLNINVDGGRKQDCHSIASY